MAKRRKRDSGDNPAADSAPAVDLAPAVNVPQLPGIVPLADGIAFDRETADILPARRGFWRGWHRPGRGRNAGTV